MNIYDFSVEKINGEFTSLREYEGKVIAFDLGAAEAGDLRYGAFRIA